MQFLTRAVGTVKALAAALLGDKRVIVISDTNVANYPVSGKVQIAAIVAVVTFLSWLSYSTGSFVAYKSVLDKKNEEINWANLEKRNMGQQFALLKRDLLKLSQNSAADMGEYESFVLDQYQAEGQEKADGAGAALTFDASEKPAENAAIDSDLIDRIDFLENRLIEEKQERDLLVDAIQQTTRGKIDELEKIIEQTGLNLKELKNKAASERKLDDESSNKKADKTDGDEQSFLGQGGPFVPEVETLGEQEKAALGEISRLMVLNSIVDALPLGHPLPGARMTSGFGRRVDPISRRWASHMGMDFSGDFAQKVLSTGEGKVVFAGRSGAYGLMVEVDHGLGITTRYGHLRKVSVTKGQQVRLSQPVGEQGSTGRSTGAHLHYEVRYNERPLNPRQFLKAGENVL